MRLVGHFRHPAVSRPFSLYLDYSRSQDVCRFLSNTFGLGVNGARSGESLSVARTMHFHLCVPATSFRSMEDMDAGSVACIWKSKSHAFA